MSGWAADLAAYERRATYTQALIAWFANPGFALSCHYRLAHWAVKRGPTGRVAARLVERRMISKFACQLSANAAIGPGIYLPHPLAIVIGEGVVIGERVAIYQGVTLGRIRAEEADYPRVGSGATVYAGAMLLGAVDIADGGRVAAGAIILGETELRAAPSARAARR